MKQIFITFCSLLLIFSLAACKSSEETQQLSSTVSAVSNEQSAEGDEPVEANPIDNNEQSESSSTDSNQPIASNSAEVGTQLADSSTEGNQQTTEVSVKKDVSGELIQITTEDGNAVIFQLNDSPAANSLYKQLPLSIDLEDYAGSEKIFYPPEELDTSNTPTAQGPAGTLAYYAPWGDVAIFYSECNGSTGLYELGEAISNIELIPTMAGKAQIEAIDAPPTLEESTKEQTAPPQPEQTTNPSSSETPSLQESTNNASPKESTAMKMNLQIGDSTFTATLEENSAVESLLGLMETAPLVIQMSDYSGFEKVGSLGTNLPTSNQQTTTQSGDIVLYNGNQIVIFYGTNSWSYTRLGKVDDLTEWKEALGNGDVTVTFSIA